MLDASRYATIVLCCGLSLLGLAVGACSTVDSEPPASTPGGFLETSRARYDAVLRTDGYARWVVDVPYVTRNTTADTLVLIGCNTPPQPILEKRVEGAWRTAYDPVRRGCLSPPWTLAPGETRRDTLHVSAALPGQNWAPVFNADEIEGTYRLNREIHRKTGTKTADALIPPTELLSPEKRVSNPFELEGVSGR